MGVLLTRDIPAERRGLTAEERLFLLSELISLPRLSQNMCSEDRRAPQTTKDAATADLVRMLYPELRRLAQLHLRQDCSGRSLQPAVLVGEVFVRLARQGEHPCCDRSHFLRAAARAVRLCFRDAARTHDATENSGRMIRIRIPAIDAAADERSVAYIFVDRLLEKMADLDPRMAEVVELKIFGGLGFEEIAEVLGLHNRTAKRDWQVARAWLFGQLREGQEL